MQDSTNFFSQLGNQGRIILKGGESGNFLEGYTNTGTQNVTITNGGKLLLGTTTEGEANADDLTVATSGNTGITVRSGTTNKGNIYFSDGTSGDAEYRGIIEYNHDGDTLKLGTANYVRATISSAGATVTGKVTATGFDLASLSALP